MPLISVVIPTHNRPDMLAEALTSVLAQTFTDYEIIIVSNGEYPENRERSRAIAELAGATWFALNEGNLPAARNFGISRAQGEWIAFLDDDDLWLPEKLERQISAARRTGADVITCGHVDFSLDGIETPNRLRIPAGWSHLKAVSRYKWCPGPSSMMIRQSALLAVGGFDKSFRRSESFDLLRRILWRHGICHMEDILMRYRLGHPSLSRDERSRHFHDMRHFFKMRRDTPSDLRNTLPSALTFLPAHLIGALAPPWLAATLHRIKPRTRILELRSWILTFATSDPGRRSVPTSRD